jgi:hypothetical protein
MAPLRLGDRAHFGGRVQTVGLAAVDPSGAAFALTAVDVGAALRAGRLPPEVTAADLITDIALPALPNPPLDDRMTVGPLCDPEKILNVTVHRFHPDFGRVQGLVSAFRGVVRMRAAGAGDVLVTELIEVTFDEADEADGRPTPPIEAQDAGSLVTTWDGQVIGLLVGGGGHLGFIAPVAGALRTNGLTHQQVEPSLGAPWADLGRRLVEAEAGIASFGAELAREPSLGLSDVPEAA